MIGFIYHRTPHLQVMTVGSSHSICSIHKSRHLTFVETKHTLQHVGYLFFRGLPIASNSHLNLKRSIFGNRNVTTQGSSHSNSLCTSQFKHGLNVFAEKGRLNS